MAATYIKKIMHNMICVTLVCIQEDNMFFVGQVSGLVKNSNIAIYTDTINVINVKLCMMVLLIDYTPFSDLDHISRSQQCQTVLTENFVFFSN